MFKKGSSIITLTEKVAFPLIWNIAYKNELMQMQKLIIMKA